jgi:hypothetical protein
LAEPKYILAEPRLKNTALGSQTGPIELTSKKKMT